MSEKTVNWQASMRLRVLIAAGFLGLWVVGIEARLIYLQVYPPTELMKRAQSQQEREWTLPAERGDIVDRNGKILATSANTPSIIAVPKNVEDVQHVITQLCRVFKNCTREERETWLTRLSEKDRDFWRIRRNVSDEEAARITALELPAVGVRQETRRHYPNGELAAQVLGFVGVDENDRENRGLWGIEASLDKDIRGRDGVAEVVVDSKKRPFDSVQVPPTAGSTVELTIDQNLQHIVEQELQAALKHYRAEAVTAIAMDPYTGFILAMANAPTFNPNSPFDAPQSAWLNRAVQDYYEPGSTFKLITASAVLEERVMTPSTMIDAGGGRIVVDGWRVIEDVHPYGMLSMRDAIVKSSNVAAVKMGRDTGREKLGSWVLRFGFGQASSPDFPGENPGRVWDPATWDANALASVSIGYQVGVTPLQMAAAVSSIANGGKLMQPRIIKAIQRPSGRVEIQPKKKQDTISPETAATLTNIMEGVTMPGGTATAAAIAGYSVAGKTGTASKLINKRYSETLRKVSFVGFVPAKNPVVTIVVMVDEPHANGEYGGTVAAPVFQRIAQRALQYLGVPPTENRPQPQLAGPRDRQQPVIRTVSVPVSAALPRVVQVSPDTPPGTLPDLRGMSGRDATRSLAARGLVVSVSGDGVVVSQEPPPGTAMSEGVVTLRLGPLSRSTGGRATGQP